MRMRHPRYVLLYSVYLLADQGQFISNGTQTGKRITCQPKVADYTFPAPLELLLLGHGVGSSQRFMLMSSCKPLSQGGKTGFPLA